MRMFQVTSREIHPQKTSMWAQEERGWKDGKKSSHEICPKCSTKNQITNMVFFFFFLGGRDSEVNSNETEAVFLSWFKGTSKIFGLLHWNFTMILKFSSHLLLGGVAKRRLHPGTMSSRKLVNEPLPHCSEWNLQIYYVPLFLYHCFPECLEITTGANWGSFILTTIFNTGDTLKPAAAKASYSPFISRRAAARSW